MSEYEEQIEHMAKALYDHWQRDVGEAARVTWALTSDTLQRVFRDKAEVAFTAYWEFTATL